MINKNGYNHKETQKRARKLINRMEKADKLALKLYQLLDETSFELMVYKSELRQCRIRDRGFAPALTRGMNDLSVIKVINTVYFHIKDRIGDILS